MGRCIPKYAFERERKATSIGYGNYEVSVQRLRGQALIQIPRN